MIFGTIEYVIFQRATVPVVPQVRPSATLVKLP